MVLLLALCDDVPDLPLKPARRPRGSGAPRVRWRCGARHPRPPPRAVAAYFLVGALTGLFARSQAEWTADTAVGDFGLSTARLLHVPWLSGLSAVAGVLVTSVIDNQFMSQNPNNTEIATLFEYRPPLFIVAAVFGLTPDLIIRRLTQQAEVYKGDLQSTETSQSIERTQTTQTSKRT
jgi:hypothetical protein